MMLGDLGADVIKVEALDGDPGRAMFAIRGVDRSLPGGRNSYFEANHRNKRFVGLNLKHPEGRKVVHKLVADADIFIQNFRKGVAGRLGLDYETLRELNPNLIYASGSGYGPKGPDAEKPALDSAAQARSGLMMATGPEGADPYPINGAVGDQMGGIILSWGILAALAARSIHGIGQKVEVSHLSASMWLQGLAVSMGQLTKDKPNSEVNQTANQERQQAFNPISNYYKCKDGRWIMFANFESDRYWPRFAPAVGRPELTNDPRFQTSHARTENRVKLISILDEVFRKRTYAEWDEILSKDGDFIYAPVQRVSELEHDPQVEANGYLANVTHPVLGKVKLADHPVRYSETPHSIRSVAGELGQHTEEVLLELNYTWEDIGRLQESGVIL